MTLAAPGRARRPGLLAGALIAGLVFGMAACGGDDDDAGQTIPDAGTLEETPTTAPVTTGPTVATEAAGGATTEPTGTVEPAGTPPSTGSPGGTSELTAGTDGVTATSEPSAATAATEGTDQTEGTDETEGTEPPHTTDFLPSGPTTTGPECEYERNVELPIVRCNSGPAVQLLQSILQVSGYEISTVDARFGDETLWAVIAFQENKQLTVDGIVGSETWAALEVPLQYGEDRNGNGQIEPNEVVLD